MRRIAYLSTLALLVAAAPAALAADRPASAHAAPTDEAAASDLALYCFLVDPATVGTVVVYPGGKYCVPGP